MFAGRIWMAVLFLRINCDRQYFNVGFGMECRLGGEAGDADIDRSIRSELGVHHSALYFFS